MATVSQVHTSVDAKPIIGRALKLRWAGDQHVVNREYTGQNAP
jgi:hypothetical protein